MSAVAATTDHRRRLLDAFAQSVAEKGVANTQITDIVRIARVSRRTFYECFADKQSAFVELARAASAEVLAAVETADDANLSWAEQVDRSVDHYLAVLSAGPVLVAAISHELRVIGVEGAAVRRENIEAFADVFVRRSREPRAREAGIEPLDPELAFMLVGGISEAIHRAAADGRPLTELAGPIKEMIWRLARPAELGG